jgi:hypothetical protein
MRARACVCVCERERERERRGEGDGVAAAAARISWVIGNGWAGNLSDNAWGNCDEEHCRTDTVTARLEGSQGSGCSRAAWPKLLRRESSAAAPRAGGTVIASLG